MGSTPIGAIQQQQQAQQQIQQMQQEQQQAIASQLSASTVAAAVADAQAQMSSGSSNLMAATSTAQPTVQTLQNELLKDVSELREWECSRPRSFFVEHLFWPKCQNFQ